MTNTNHVIVIGGGLAGSEAAWQLLNRGVQVTLCEMKPFSFSPAHKSSHLAELVCSNSLRSNEVRSAVGLLKEELRLMNSLIIEAADHTSVPAGRALAVDRKLFSLYVEEKLSICDGLTIERREISDIPTSSVVIIASGPLTSDALAENISTLTGGDNLYFYDAISPIIDAESIDYSKVFRASRYDEDEGDYLNCPLSKEEYERFRNEVLAGKETVAKDFEDKKCFEGCLPIEVLARRGVDTLRYGPMKPVGLTDPRTKAQPYAVVQLRSENRNFTLFNMVGFQTKLTWPEQERIFSLIPGLEKAEFARFGSIHRNTFINAPHLLRKTLELNDKSGIFFAGQITGVEGYVESTAMGLLAGINASRYCNNRTMVAPPETTALGALCGHITNESRKYFQPMNVNFGLFPSLDTKMPKKERGKCYAERALTDLAIWRGEVDVS
ncbi:MAG: methylenetetrahydrofolate--tRNA-(uracil(54)-C(5))-methyltransferase (FADH(2)-oxidizing) TrmFO [Deltaproteobacteria bacterium]|nr:methylenetetrahydrofolate--tRNA-(uracil(54)-C(5))-methyltransferase (FADH(2)-oxidizing) TrmFO [Deltaproteobacteria bacterium]MBN2845953.1 methylenetetrahydrofolate--tRNA-(uracil(54)-C(5))-methyltransferase (FADH(2)-oxidizing) TrmFO [Deltaproteobacteria bacterium]